MYFLRQYLKGVKGSGTKDIWSGDFVPTEDEILETFGDNGKMNRFPRWQDRDDEKLSGGGRREAPPPSFSLISH